MHFYLPIIFCAYLRVLLSPSIETLFTLHIKIFKLKLPLYATFNWTESKQTGICFHYFKAEIFVFYRSTKNEKTILVRKYDELKAK